jgi:hypothetical protein
MTHTLITRRAASAALILILGAGLLTACGGSSKGSTASASASATTATTGATGTRTGRFAGLRECLQRNGITLPKRRPGQGAGVGGLLGGGSSSGATGPRLPSGVSRPQYEAAIKKCGGLGAFRSFRGGAAPRLNNPAFKQAIANFAQCMRQNGVNVPAPKTSGGGPIFNSAGIDTKSAQFKAAEAKCLPALRSSTRPSTGGPGG